MILPGLATGKSEFQPGERAAGGGRRLFGEIGKRFEVAIAPAQDFAEVAGQRGIHRLQIDDGIALDHAEPQAIIRFKTDDLHESCPCLVMTGQGLAQEGDFGKVRDQARGAARVSASVKAWIEK